MLVDSFKRLAYQASTLTTKDSIRLSYATKFYDLLSNISIDSIRVHVDSVKIVDSTISTQFHCGTEIVFKSSLTFPAQMTPKYDSLFEFLKGLRPGLDTLVSFGYMGNHQVRLPSSDDPILKIFAYPVPIWIGNN